MQLSENVGMKMEDRSHSKMLIDTRFMINHKKQIYQIHQKDQGTCIITGLS